MGKLVDRHGFVNYVIPILLKPRQRGGDTDAYWKSCLDALCQAELLVDDNRQHVELCPVQYRRATDATWGTAIFLEDIGDSAR